MSAFDDRSPPTDYLGLGGSYDPASEEFAELRELLLGKERRQLEELQRRLDTLGLSPEELAEHLPEALALRAGRDQKLAKALAPTVENALSESVRRNPKQIATAIFPVLGPAIRKAIAEAMAGLVSSINHAMENSLSLRGLRWRVEGWRTGVPYAQIVLRHALVYRVEQVFLIHAETGLLLGHAAPPDLKAADGDLISGMLTAIQDFVSDSFHERETGGLRSFCVGELTVIVEPGPQAVIAAVVRGQPPATLLPRLQDTLENIHLQLVNAFAEFSGDASRFAPAHPLLEECLETVLSTDRGMTPRSKGAWMRWAIPLAFIVVTIAFLSWRSRRAWTTAMNRLQAEPGIELLETSRGGGRWRVRGLRDPLSADPALVLASINADPSRLEARWEPYLSLEPSLVVERTRRWLAAPATLSLVFRRDSVIVSGTAPLAWVGGVLARPTLPPGVAAIDLSRVDAELPPGLAALRNDTEQRLVLFDPGSATLSSVSRGMLAGVAGSFRPLAREAEEMGYRVSLQLIGRTDSTGTDAVNQALSLQRVEAARTALISIGMAPAELDGIGIGTSRPLAPREGADQSRINRSVAFVVRLNPLGGRLARKP
jgi:outer membrane protein OmpA-like peptidoglycan-associated protein